MQADNNKVMKNQGNATLTISDDLYDQLRDYCDHENIRFRGFIEESLESAIFRKEQIQVLEESRRLKKEIDKIRNTAYLRGFQQGFFSAFCAAQGKLPEPRHDETIKKAVKDNPNKIVDDKQLTLFD